MASKSDCIAAVKAAAGRDLSEDQIEQIFEWVQRRTRRHVATGMAPDVAAQRAGRELADETRLAGILEKRNALKNEAAKQAIQDTIVQGREAAGLRQAIKDTDASIRGMRQEFFGPLVRELDEAGVMKILKRGDAAFERDVRKEIFALDNGQPHATKNTQAQAAAKAISKFNDTTRNAMNDAGAWIGRLDDYIAFQSHDQGKLRKAGFEAWQEFVVPRLSQRTFAELPDTTPEALTEYLRQIYNNLKNGVHETSQPGTIAGFTGPGNLAKRVSHERKLVFKDAEARSDYDETFGRGNLMDNIVRSGNSAARNVALMQRWGTNPQAMFDKLNSEYLAAANRRDDEKAVKALQGAFNQRMMAVVDGTAQVPQDVTLANITSWAQAFQTVTKLGGVVLSSIPDIAVNAATLRHNGVGLFASYANSITSLIPNAGRRQVAYDASVAIDGALQSLASTIHGTDITGRASKLVDFFHKVNFLEWWTTSMKNGVGTMLTHNLARNAAADFGALSPRLQRTLGQYGIGEVEWGKVRGLAQKAADGREHILPSMIEDAATRQKFQTYVADQISIAMTEPDAYSRTITTWGTQAGTIGGTMARLMMQFKSYPITFMTRTLAREWRDVKTGDVGGMASLIASVSLLGFVSSELKDMAKGREPRSARMLRGEAGYEDYAGAVFAALKQGGGLGFYGDFLFGQPNRFGGPVSDLVLGPSFGTADDAGKLLQGLIQATAVRNPRDNPERDLPMQAIKFFRDNAGALGIVPGMAPAALLNTFYGRLALDTLVIHRLQEAVNPGYQTRYEDRIRREQHREFWLAPTNSFGVR